MIMMGKSIRQIWVKETTIMESESGAYNLRDIIGSWSEYNSNFEAIYHRRGIVLLVKNMYKI